MQLEKIIAELKKQGFSLAEDQFEAKAEEIAEAAGLTDESTDEEIAAAVKEANKQPAPAAEPQPAPAAEPQPAPAAEPQPAPAAEPQPLTLESLAARLEAYERREQAAARKSELDAILADAGFWGEIERGRFEYIKNATAEEWSKYIEQVKSDLTKIKQELNNLGLAAVTPPSGGNATISGVATDAEIENLFK